MSKELNIENLEKALEAMGSATKRSANLVARPKMIHLSNYAIGLGFSAKSAEEFIRQELEGID